MRQSNQPKRYKIFSYPNTRQPWSVYEFQPRKREPFWIQVSGNYQYRGACVSWAQRNNIVLEN